MGTALFTLVDPRLCRAVLVALALTTGIASQDRVTSKDSPASSELPIEAQYAVSATLGREQAAYHAKKTSVGLRADNRSHGFSVSFTAKGVEVERAGTRFSLALEAIGRGDALDVVRAARPESRSNRVEYRRGPITEWYVNGPLGLQQGFTIDRRIKGTGEKVTVALRLGNEIEAVVDSDRAGVTLESAGSAVLRFGGLLAYDAVGRQLPASMRVDSDALLLEVDDTGAQYPVVVDPFLQRAKLTASDGGPWDAIGTSVSVSGDTVVVGAQDKDLGRGRGQGAAYVFVRPTTGWRSMTEVARLTASDGAPGHRFGKSVSVAGNTIVISGKDVYVFVKPPTGWQSGFETAKLTASDAPSVGLGGAVASDLTTIVAASSKGVAYLFERPVTGWQSMTETTQLKASGSAGSAIAVRGGSVVVTGYPAGYIFVKPTAGWPPTSPEVARLTQSDSQASDRFGASATIGPNSIVIGAYDHDIGSNNAQGAAYLFARPSGGWTSMTETAKLTSSDGGALDNLGHGVSIDGDLVAIGARGHRHGGGHGAVYLYVKPPTGWKSGTETGKITYSGGSSKDAFGTSVSVDGDTIAVGTPYIGGAFPVTGSAYVFTATNLRGPPTARPGSRVTLNIEALRDPALPYQLGSSLGTGPIPIGNRKLGLSPDNLLVVSANAFWPTIFPGYRGVLDNQGQANAAINIPNLVALVGQTIHTAFVTVSPSAPQGIKSISNTYSFTIQS